MKLKLIAAIGKNNELGNAGDLPLWKLRTDMERFKKMTEGAVVVMGRKTYLSFPEKFRPLPNRRNIILTRDGIFKIDGAESFTNLDALIPLLLKEELGVVKDIFIIGGGEIYRQFVDIVDELHITHVDGEFAADTFFPEINPNIWEKTFEEIVPADEKNSHKTKYIIYKKSSLPPL